jgi:hypothetical protein
MGHTAQGQGGGCPYLCDPVVESGEEGGKEGGLEVHQAVLRRHVRRQDGECLDGPFPKPPILILPEVEEDGGEGGGRGGGGRRGGGWGGEPRADGGKAGEDVQAGVDFGTGSVHEETF